MDLNSIEISSSDMGAAPFQILTENNYEVFEFGIASNGRKMYSVGITSPVIDWLRETYVEGMDYTWNRTLKGVWVNIPEEIFVVLKLKWT